MSKSFSLYLDILRALAALVVFLWHTEESFFSNDVLIEALHIPDNAAHLAVIVFFVLSGFLIDRSATKPGVTLGKFLFDRATRLYSVVIPALILTILSGVLVELFRPEVQHSAYEQSWMGLRYAVNFLFLQQIWFFCVVPGANNPFWSLSYEFWYYMGLAAAVFLPRWWKIIGLIGVSLITGPKILLLAPAWLAGVLAHRLYQKDFKVNRLTGLVVFATTCLLLFVALSSDFWQNMTIRYPLYYSSRALPDFVFALIVGLNIFIAASVFPKTDALPLLLIKFTAPLRFIATRSFSLYLYHFPLLFVSGALLPYNKDSALEVAAVAFLVFSISMFLAEITECQLKTIKLTATQLIGRLRVKC